MESSLIYIYAFRFRHARLTMGGDGGGGDSDGGSSGGDVEGGGRGRWLYREETHL